MTRTPTNEPTLGLLQGWAIPNPGCTQEVLGRFWGGSGATLGRFWELDEGWTTDKKGSRTGERATDGDRQSPKEP